MSTPIAPNGGKTAVRFRGSRAEKPDDTDDPEGSFFQNDRGHHNEKSRTRADVALTSAEAVSMLAGEVGFDAEMAKLQEMMRQSTRKMLDEARSTRAKTDVLTYCLALRTALAFGQGFCARELDEDETERIHERLTLRAARAVLANVEKAVERQMWFTAYDALNAFLISALSSGGR
ncbi:MAG TPA: hypothetical protein VJP85_05595 [Candidatus Baltobacteraceae bacterium]|nr:hypothetical protein [Candidatus Baltobacteraceae bacterium]